MIQSVKNKLADDMAEEIAKAIQDPRGWPREARLVAESLGLRVAGLRLCAPTLDEITSDIVCTAAEYSEKTEAEIREAIAEISSRDRS